MDAFIPWCGFFGAWLLVAGPVYQAAIELGDEELQREQVGAHLDDLRSREGEAHPPVSPWWWLFPPVLYVLHRRRDAALQESMLAQLTPEETVLLVDYLNRATGWVLVGTGGTLLAAKETWELCEHQEWPTWTFWLLGVLMAGLCLANAALRTGRSRSIVEHRRRL